MDDLIRTAKKRYDEATTAEHENREAAAEDLRFLSGDQWPDKVKAQREGDGRPCLTINKLPGFVDQVVGDARQNNLAIKVHPVDSGADPQTADVFEGIIHNIESVSKADTAYTTAMEFQVQAGFGYIRVCTEYADDDVFEQDIRIKTVRNPFSCILDPDAEEPDGSDARYGFVSETMNREDFKDKFPGKTPVEFVEGGDGNDLSWCGQDDIRVAEYWWKEAVSREIVLLNTGETVDAKDFDAIADELYYQQIWEVRRRKVKTDQVKWAKIDGQQVLEGPQDWPGKYIPIVPVWGKELLVDGKRQVRGMVRYARDAQRMYNYWRSIATETVALAPKAPFLVTADHIAGYESVWNKAHQQSLPYLPYTPDAQAPPPQRLAPALPNTAALNELAVAADDMKATTGIYDASLGARSNETSGRAILARQREGDVAHFAYHDNLARAIEQVGRILVDLIPKIYDTERSIRIRGEDGSQEFVEINKRVIDMQTGQPVIINDLSAGKYDVVVSVGPSYTTRRLEAADSMIAFMQAFPQAAGVIGDLLVKNLDWPGSDEIVERLQKLLPPGMLEKQDGPGGLQGPPQQQQMNPDQMKMQLDIEGKALNNKLKEIKLQRELAGTGQLAGPGPMAPQPIMPTGGMPGY